MKYQIHLTILVLFLFASSTFSEGSDLLKKCFAFAKFKLYNKDTVRLPSSDPRWCKDAIGKVEAWDRLSPFIPPPGKIVFAVVVHLADQPPAVFKSMTLEGADIGVIADEMNLPPSALNSLVPTHIELVLGTNSGIVHRQFLDSLYALSRINCQLSLANPVPSYLLSIDSAHKQVVRYVLSRGTLP